MDVFEKDDRRIFDPLASSRNDHRQIVALVRDIAFSGSLMGQALKERQISFQECNRVELQRTIECGNDVLVLGLIRSGNTWEGHAFHIGYEEGRFISISDGSQQISLRPGVLLEAIVFSNT